jgi:hypothetical protein
MASEELYTVITAVLLLAALGAAIPVLRGILRDGIERQQSGEATLTPESDSESDGESTTAPRETRAVCSKCATPNDPAFSYCRECGTRL